MNLYAIIRVGLMLIVCLDVFARVRCEAGDRDIDPEQLAGLHGGLMVQLGASEVVAQLGNVPNPKAITFDGVRIIVADENSGLEFDPFDILHAEGDSIAMSRWIISADGKKMDVDKWNAFAKLNTGAGEVWIPRGSWTYGARHQHRFAGEASRRPLTVFRDDNAYSSLDGNTSIFRRDFNLEKGEAFNNHWITGWEAGKIARDGGKPYGNERIAKNSIWTQDPFAETGAPATPFPEYGTQLFNEI